MDDMTTISAVIDSMLPGDATMSMPSASDAGVARYLAQHAFEALVVDFTQLLENVALAKCGQPFLSLDAAARLKAIDACKLANVRLFSAFLTQVLRAYYTAPAVLRLIGSGSVPPFPTGNELAQDDWSMLEAVFERGQVYREPP